MTPEFHRPIEADTVSETARPFDIGADAAERRRLAGRFRLVELRHLTASIVLQRRAGVIHADGAIEAEVVQACAVTAEPIPAKLKAPVHVRFAADAMAVKGDEFELSEADCDTLPIDNGRIDLGELAAETLALALDPYPRSAQADAVMREQAAAQATESGPFAALKDLKSRPGD